MKSDQCPGCGYQKSVTQKVCWFCSSIGREPLEVLETPEDDGTRTCYICKDEIYPEEPIYAGDENGCICSSDCLAKAMAISKDPIETIDKS